LYRIRVLIQHDMTTLMVSRARYFLRQPIFDVSVAKSEPTELRLVQKDKHGR